MNVDKQELKKILREPTHVRAAMWDILTSEGKAIVIKEILKLEADSQMLDDLIEMVLEMDTKDECIFWEKNHAFSGKHTYMLTQSLIGEGNTPKQAIANAIKAWRNWNE